MANQKSKFTRCAKSCKGRGKGFRGCMKSCLRK